MGYGAQRIDTSFYGLQGIFNLEDMSVRTTECRISRLNGQRMLERVNVPED